MRLLPSILVIYTIITLTTSQVTNELANVGTDLGFKLYREAAKEAENVFLSPFSISTALALTYQGAEGVTEQEMSQVLGFSRLSTSNVNQDYQTMNDAIFETKEYTLKTANRLYGQSGTSFLQTFLDPLQLYYNAPLEEKDFAGRPSESRQEINQWVEDQTEKKIKDLLPQGSIDASTVLVLVNAIYFKGNWVQQFKEEETEEEYFNVSSLEKVKVPMMKITNKLLKFHHDKEKKAKILQLPYDGNGDDEVDENDDVAMYIILPDVLDGLPDVVKDLDSSTLNTMISSMSYKSVVSVKLPRFNITQQLSLKTILSNLGMESAFTGAADFSGMTGSRGLYIDAVIHQAVVEVNEKGTTAAAATGVVIAESAPPEPPMFEADHPFLFLIREENTGSVLFLGSVKNPGDGQKEPNVDFPSASIAPVPSPWIWAALLVLNCFALAHPILI